MKALAVDNVNLKFYNVCIKATTEGDYESKDYPMTFEILCNSSNKIDASGLDKRIFLNGTPELRTGVYIFDKLNQITTILPGCPVTSYEIELISDVAKMVSLANCTTIPCRDIVITGTDKVTSPQTLDFTVKLTAAGSVTMLVEQSIEIICSITSTVIEQPLSMITYAYSTPLSIAKHEFTGFRFLPSNCPVYNYTVYDETCSDLYDESLIT